MTHVLDASAILALLFNEPGAERVEAVMETAMVSSVNFSEVVAKLSEKGASDDVIRASTESFVSMCRPFDAPLALDAGLLRDRTCQAGLSLGDRACLALGMKEKAVVLTADKAWKTVAVGVEIEVIR